MEEKLHWLLRGACFVLMAAMVAVIFVQVIARYALSDSLSWSEEVGRYLFVWMTFLGAALAVRNRLHVSLDMLVTRLPPGGQRICWVISYASMFVFTLILIYGGYAFVLRGSRQTSAALQMPMQYVYLVLPVSGLLILFYLFRNFFRDMSGKR